MAYRRMEGLPYLPGNTFTDPTITDFRRSQTLDHCAGFRHVKADYLGIGDIPIPEKALGVKDLFDTYNYDPAMTYGIPRPKAPKAVIPAFVALEKKVLRFYAYYKESVNDSPDEIFRVRRVEILYFLEDDSIMVCEPKIENSGLMQGKFLRRHRVPKNDLGETYHWKDLNVKCDIMFYGRVFRIVDADEWTKKFYESEGLILNDTEELPKDPYTEKRYNSMKRQTFTSPSTMIDARKKYMEFDKKALRFNCIWDDREALYGGIRKVDLYYHLADDRVELNEIRGENSGRDPYTLILHKTKLPKNWKDLPLQFPVVSLEIGEKEFVEYYEPKDFKIGDTINVFGRRLLIFDMDDFTKQFYRDNFGYSDFTPMCIDEPEEPKIEIKPPPWNGYGSPEDSLQSWLHIVPQRPRYDAMKRLVFELKLLKFGAVIDSTRPEDQGREFTISYRLVDDKISVYERPVRNSGWPGGKFLDYVRLMKPGSSKDDPEYYGPHDLYVGSVLDVYGHRFCLNAVDPFVLEFINANPDCFPDYVRDNIREYFRCEHEVNPKRFEEKVCNPGKPVCEEPIGEGFFEQLGLGIQNLNIHPCQDNPNPFPMPYDWDRCRTLGYNGGVQRLPADQICGGDDPPCETPCPGNPDMFEAKECAVCIPEREVPPEPIMPNPAFEEPLKVPRDKYYPMKEHRFDCYNPPDADQQYETYQKNLRFKCPCPPEDKSKQCK